MCCVVSIAKPACSTLLLLLSALVVAGFDAAAAQTSEPETTSATPSLSWCVARSDVPPDCGHFDYLSCSIAAIFKGGSCVREEPPQPAEVTAFVAPQRQKRNVPRRKASASQQDELFREYERWKGTTTR